MITRSLLAKMESTVKCLILEQEIFIDSLKCIYDANAKLGLNPIIYEEVKSLYQRFDANHTQLKSFHEKNADVVSFDEITALYINFTRLYYPLIANIQTTTSPVSNVKTEAAPVAGNHTFHLPSIKLPNFDGKPDHWNNFKILFDSTVHSRDDLALSQKFQLLRTHLSGSALALIANLEINDAAYEQAYKLLCDRFENPRYKLNFHHNKLIKLTPADTLEESLNNFATVFLPSMNALKNLKVDLSDFFLLQCGLSSLPAATRMQFEAQVNTDVPTVEQLIAFVNNLQRSHEAFHADFDIEPVSPTPVKSIRSPQTANFTPVRTRFTRGASSSQPRVQKTLIATDPDSSRKNYSNTSNNACVFCDSDNHKIYACTEFLLLSVNDRYKHIKRLQRCFGCLGNHPRSRCKSTRTCNICASPTHNTLLHVSDTNSEPLIKMIPANADSGSTLNSDPNSTQVHLSCRSNQKNVLLGTTHVLIYDMYHQPLQFRAVIDPGSQATLITADAVQQLKLNVRSSDVKLVGLNSNATSAKGNVTLKMTSALERRIVIRTNAIIVPKITGNIPAAQLDPSVIKKCNFSNLADRQFYKPAPVQVLLGADVFSDILVNCNIRRGEPSILQTVFGSVIIGRVLFDDVHAFQAASRINTFVTTVDPITSTLQKFWELEEIPEVKPLDPNDVRCEELFTATTSRDDTGRYTVALPFRKDSVGLESNRDSAFRIHRSLERRLHAQPLVRQKYNDFMQEYIDLCHMEIAETPSNYVIPHHCVFKESSSTTKLRVVFNASNPDCLGNSLNAQLLPGPKLQRDLSDILLNFRLHRFVICSDLKMMYRQILVRPSDRRFQHIFFRDDQHAPLQEYELRTVTYGLTPSAYLSQRVLHQLVQDDGIAFPLAAHAITNHSYVDDIISGSDTFENASLLIQQLIQLFSLGGFQLRKWASNCPELLSHIPESHRETPLQFNDESSGFKILGLQWNSSEDEFSYSITEFQPPFTKRNILSYIARTFDPLGLLAPLIFSMKYFLKLLWEAQLNWDDPLPQSLCALWSSFIENISTVSTLRIPRFIGSPHSAIGLLGFCDASQKGYAACIYLHVTSGDHVTVNLIKAKSRIAPAKTISIPRLELCGALLLSRLLHSVVHALPHINLRFCYLFTDATIVLNWLHISPHKLKCFVANRITKILESTDANSWFHIASEQNPADLASRGTSPSNIVLDSLWWHGPEMFQAPQESWPALSSVEVIPELPELRSESIALITSCSAPPTFIEYFAKFSSFLRLIRTVAYLLRFVQVCRKTLQVTQRSLTASEIESATEFCVRITQEYYFSKEIKLLREKRHNSLSSLSPFFDSAGLLRVGGRLDNSSLEYSSVHPLLLPKKCTLSNLICDHYHQQSLHSGPRTTQSIILQKFWIISLRSLLRSRIRNCLTCFRFRTSPVQPLMASLPSHRVTPLRAFQAVGVDFAGPFNVKINNLRNSRSVKGYLCIFVCMSTKAVHLECVSDLTTDAFLAAFDRFISRRGLPSDVYSDNGTNFVGAAAYFKEIHKILLADEDHIISTLASKSINWHFNPPSAPNFGGLWEAAVKSSKIMLRRVIGDTPLTFEEFSTIFSRIEAILNSRPLYDFSPDPTENATLLTPGHFLIGTSLLQPPEQPIPEDIPLKSRWLRIRQVIQTFWKLWSQHYLHTLVQRLKWNRATSTLIVDQPVLIYGINTPPARWPLGRILELHPGKDGIPRIATVQTSFGVYKRPVNKLVTFPAGN